MEYPGFVGPSYTLQNVSAECQRTINLYPQTDETGLGKNKVILVSTPGLKQFSYLGVNTPVRGIFAASNGRVFAVSGLTFFELFIDGTMLNWGTLALSSDVNSLVSMDDNGLVIFMVDGPNGYTFNFTTGTFVIINAPVVVPPPPPAWKPLTFYGYNGFYISPLVAGAPVVQQCTLAGVTGAGAPPAFSSVPGTVTNWGTSQFTARKTVFWTPSTTFTRNSYIVTATSIYICTQTGISGSSQAGWTTNPSSVVHDGGAGWLCLSQLLAVNFIAPFGVEASGSILAGGYTQSAIYPEITFTSAPVWNTTVGGLTYEGNGTVIWLNAGVYPPTGIVDPNFFGGDSIAFINGFFAFNQPNTQVFWITKVYSAMVDPLGFASVEGNPDKLVCLLADHQELWMFGTNSIEVWYDAGGSLFPFSKIQGAYISHGIAAKASPQRLDNTVFWLGRDEAGAGIVWRANGYSPLRISTHAMEQEMQRYSRIDDATAFAYQQDGHSFYVLNFPSGNKTWVYDAATNLWHERAYMNPDGSLGRGRPNVHVYAFGKHLVGDYANGIIYEMSPAFLTDNLVPIARIRTAPFIDAELNNVFHSKFQLDMQVGVGSPLALETDTPPQMILTFSDDGGYTWSNEKLASMGASGQFKTRVIWRRLGRSRQRVYRVKTTEPVSVTLYNAYLDLEQGSS